MQRVINDAADMMKRDKCENTLFMQKIKNKKELKVGIFIDAHAQNCDYKGRFHALYQDKIGIVWHNGRKLKRLPKLRFEKTKFFTP